MSEELKPCPFCGSPSVTTQARHPSILPYFVECSTCDARGARREGREAAITAWNSRPIEDKLQARIDALEWLREVEAMREALQPTWWANRKVTIGEDAYKASRLEFLDTEDNANIEVNTALAAASAAVEVENE